MQVLRNGLNLTGFEAYWQPAAIGFVIIVAIMLDRARQNPQVAAYFRQFEGRVAVVSVLSMCIITFLVALQAGYGADSMLVFSLALPTYSLLYFLYYRSNLSQGKLDALNWMYLVVFLALSGIVGGLALTAIWLAVRYAVGRLIKSEGGGEGLALQAA
jgi:hypothetical protein